MMTKHLPRRVGTEEEVSERRRRNLNKWVSRIVLFAICLLYALFLLLPFYVIFVTSITPTLEYGTSSEFIWFPEEATFEAYQTIFLDDPMYLTNGQSSIVVGFLNTLWLTLTTTIVGLFVSGLAAFAYAKLKFRWKNVLFMFMLVTTMIPSAVMTIPSYVFYNAIGWGQGFAALLIPSLFGGAITVFFLRSYMTSIPTETIEAAKIDGLGPFGIYCRIIIPLSIPAFVAQFIFGFVGGYNNYAGPLIYLSNNPEWYTLQLSLYKIQDVFKEPAQLCASALIALLPLVIVYIIFQKFFIEGIAVGGGKE